MSTRFPLTLRQHEQDDDSSCRPPCLSRHYSPVQQQYFYPPPFAPFPEPSSHAQFLLREMFSEKAILRNYNADSIQAVMMALDHERQEREIIQETEASLALVRALQEQDRRESTFHPHVSPLICRDMSLEGCSSNEESSCLEYNHPAYFTTGEVMLSQQALLQFQQDIMPLPDDPPREKDEKKQHHSSSPASILKAPPGCSEPSPSATSCWATESKGGADKAKKKTKDRQCIICQRSTAECRMRMRKLGCGHHFCGNCIDRWLETKDTCPYCRQRVSENTRQKVRRQTSIGASTSSSAGE